MSAPLDFDPTRLDACLKQALPGLAGTPLLERIPGGQSNPTYFVTYPGQRLVLRKKPAGHVLPSAHAVEREYRILHALADSEVPVPTARLLCEDSSVIGTPFYVMDRLDGRVFSDCTLTGVAPAERRAIYLAMAETLAKLHAVDWQARGLADFGKPGDYFERQIDRWSRQWALSQTAPNADIDHLLRWLPAHVPAPSATTIVHGDFRIGNLIYHPSDPSVVGVLDWELATLGQPEADLAYSALGWRLDSSEYLGMSDQDLAALGIPTEAEYLAHYARHVPRPVRCEPFHVAFSLFRLAVIFEGIAARARQGNASSENGAEIGKLAAVFARRACEALDR